jgi:hypothetical protein
VFSLGVELSRDAHHFKFQDDPHPLFGKNPRAFEKNSYQDEIILDAAALG